ncbi:hypothetical protein [Streptomyces kronopolitis]|uniref:hypothetical protein n=1 Tax=Streptomyces kronopolitis TaxID=1612435 RepID=UPI0020C08515|nr:hypothetical protein [Streptomyces kronopolitis]MCL6302788.1 hypothetical protein [Streptomyces kronopolitis]
MMTNAKIGVALVGGYVLGRTKKAKMAIGLGMYLAGKRLNLDPRQLGKLVANSPVLGPLNDQIRGELVDATKSAATSALTQRMSTLTDSLHERTLALSDAGGDSGRGEEPSDERESAEHRDSDDDLPDDDEAEDPEDTEDTEDKRSAPSGKRTAGSSARSGKPAANKSSAGKTSATKTSAKTSAAKTSQRAKSAKTTKPGTSAKAAASGARKAGTGTRKKAAGTARATAARGGRDD